VAANAVAARICKAALWSSITAEGAGMQSMGSRVTETGDRDRGYRGPIVTAPKPRSASRGQCQTPRAPDCDPRRQVSPRWLSGLAKVAASGLPAGLWSGTQASSEPGVCG
jgi:hypothetical protein